MHEPLPDNDLVVATPERVSFDYQIAGLGTRAIAQILDLLIQAGVRNIVRIVDFLPYGYGVGLVVLFVNGKGKRLGDLAAGTIVVKDSDAVALWQLRGALPPTGAPGTPAPPPVATFAPASPGEIALRRLDPELRRFVSAYARRR